MVTWQVDQVVFSERLQLINAQVWVHWFRIAISLILLEDNLYVTSALTDIIGMAVNVKQIIVQVKTAIVTLDMWNLKEAVIVQYATAWMGM